VVAEFEQSQSRLYQLLDAAKVERNISNMLEKQPHLTKRVVDQLKDLPSEKQGEVYREAEKTAPNGKVTAAHVQNRERWRGVRTRAGSTRKATSWGFYSDGCGITHGFLLSK
jgi:ubiquinone biosynthesis protein Coq4